MTTGYFDALDIPVIAGRGFDPRDTEQGVPVVVLNARAATQLFGDPRRAVGQRLRLDNEMWREVVGVVGNVRTTFFNTLEWRTDPMVYRPAAQGLSRVANPEVTEITLWVHIRADRPLSAAEVRDAALAAGPRAACSRLQRVPDLVALATRQPTFRMTLLLWFCGASLLLAAIGVYGVVTQAVTERLREIADSDRARCASARRDGHVRAESVDRRACRPRDRRRARHGARSNAGVVAVRVRTGDAASLTVAARWCFSSSLVWRRGCRRCAQHASTPCTCSAGNRGGRVTRAG